MKQYWNQEIETMDRELLQDLQLERLKRTVKLVYENVDFYKKKMNAIGILPEDIKRLEDIRHLPFTTKQDLRDESPYGLFAQPLEEIVRIHASSGGTDNNQLVLGYTKEDLDISNECMARCFTIAEMDRNSKIQIALSYGLHTGGLMAHGGAEKIGAMVIPTSTGNTIRQVNMLKNLGVSHLYCTPSYALHIADVRDEMNLSISDFGLKVVCIGAEACSSEKRKTIENRLGVRTIDIYGSCELMGPGVSQDCQYKSGLHIWEDIFLPELIDPISLTNTGGSNVGELVITTIHKNGMPLLRYRTRDLCTLNYDKCSCGRTHVRMSKPIGRSDDAISVRGVRIFPKQIDDILRSEDIGVVFFEVIVNRIKNRDSVRVNISISQERYAQCVSNTNLKTYLSERLEAALAIKIDVDIKCDIDTNISKQKRWNIIEKS